MTDWKALCAELLADYESNRFRAELAAEARAALAQPEPAGQSEWITDRQPTAADGDRGGQVEVPDETGERTFLRDWVHVLPGEPWRRGSVLRR